MLTLNDGRNELWQWDTNRKLTVDAECSQVHFSNKVFGRSIDVDVVDGVASIPDILLQTDKELTAWAFVGTPENGYTKISRIFKVNRRNKPADYVFTPTDQTTLDEIMERVDRIEESQDPDAIKNAVDEYLQNNPIHVKETDPTVHAWAKAATKPTYTAQEVGALPADTKIPAPYTLPHATADTLGGVKVGEGLQMTGDVLGVVPEGKYELIETITIDEAETYKIIRQQTPQGQAYNYKDVVIEMESEATQTDNIIVATTIKITDGSILYDYTTNAIRKNYASIFRCWVNMGADGRYVIGSSVGGIREETIAATSCREHMGVASISKWIVGIDMSALAAIPIGTLIKIWGGASKCLKSISTA